MDITHEHTECPTKSQMRRDIRNAREHLRIIERAIKMNDMETAESWSRSLEAIASLLACDAAERTLHTNKGETK